MNMYLLSYPMPFGTPGDLIINSKIFCHTLEDIVRQDPKEYIKGDTAIPSGRYQVELTFSNRFQRVLPLIKNVPGYEGIRMHSGNTTKDTTGCVLCAYNRSEDNSVIYNEQGLPKAIDAIVDLLKGEKENWIEIVRTYPYRGGIIKG